MQNLNTQFQISEKHEPRSDKGIYAVSKRVESYRQVSNLVNSLTSWLNTNNGQFDYDDIHKTAYAIAHSQVADEPFDLFIVNEELINKYDIKTKGQNKSNFFFPSQAIFNARIIESPLKIKAKVPKREVVTKNGSVDSKVVVTESDVNNKIQVSEGCMSFPHRTPKNVERFYRIKVKYQVKGFFGLKTITEWVEGLKAHIFQHEIDHAQGKNIYFK